MPNVERHEPTAARIIPFVAVLRRGRLPATVGGHASRVAVVRRDEVHDHNIVTDVLGILLGVALVVLLIAATLAGSGLLLVRWADSLGA